MKLDTRAMRHLAPDDWKVLAAVEQGSKNHEIVPTTIIERFSRIKGGVSGVHRCISNLAKVGLIAKIKEQKYDGYRLTYGGLDYLALHTHAQKNAVYSVGSRVGVGKESDIMIVADDTGAQKILKIHRLGRISFRTVKTNRDYLKNKPSASWMYLSCLAARKEFAFMTALQEEGFPVPTPIAQSRHTIVMSLVDAPPLRQISSVPDPASLYAELIALLLRFAKHGLIHGDYNEFNILIKDDVTTAEDGIESIKLTPVVIDFPQMISMEHVNAEMYFDRDVECIKRVFARKFHFTSTTPGPFYKDAKKTIGKDGARRLDAVLEASGITKKMAKELEAAIRQEEAEKEANPEAFENEDEEEGSEEEEEDSGEEEGEEEEEEQRVIVIGDDGKIAGVEEMKKLSINDGT
ncbi:RIO1 family-domain-containing protein [Podospora fimiseda]|uniref:Serine/threonine-protein kinase RIO2 n=1 Tax=Podospora fimiseda TaxID=252190 RepID=A0AAN7BJQ6_9PEZI|nr:RIO1 family-domain-containing protein [Podospora fimiseda]